MVTEIETDDGTRFRCAECGRTFEDREAAADHEADCFVPPSM